MINILKLEGLIMEKLPTINYSLWYMQNNKVTVGKVQSIKQTISNEPNKIHTVIEMNAIGKNKKVVNLNDLFKRKEDLCNFLFGY